MKIITLSKIGYNAPSGTNWVYGIWKIDLLDTDREYCMSHTVKETFGGDSRLRSHIKELLNVTIIETKSVYTGTGTPRITGVSKLLDMEDEDMVEIIKDFFNSK